MTPKAHAERMTGKPSWASKGYFGSLFCTGSTGKLERNVSHGRP